MTTLQSPATDTYRNVQPNCIQTSADHDPAKYCTSFRNQITGYAKTVTRKWGCIWTTKSNCENGILCTPLREAAHIYLRKFIIIWLSWTRWLANRAFGVNTPSTYVKWKTISQMNKGFRRLPLAWTKQMRTYHHYPVNRRTCSWGHSRRLERRAQWCLAAHRKN